MRRILPLILAVLSNFLIFYSISLHAEETAPDSSFTVVGFNIEGLNPISQEQTDKTLSVFLGDHYDLEGLIEAAAELESVILNEGHSFYRVSLPPQTIKEGVVTLKIKQILISKIDIVNNRFFSEVYVVKTYETELR